MKATMKELKMAFTEWDRRCREEPEKFQNDVEHLLHETPMTYGDSCGPYFAQIIKDIQSE